MGRASRSETWHEIAKEEMLKRSWMLVPGTTLALHLYAALHAQTPVCKPNQTYAQHLVDATLSRHPELLGVVFHVTPPNTNDNIVIASNGWGIGLKSDEDDLKVVQTGTPATEVNLTATKFEVQAILTNVMGETVGSVATIFPYKKGESKTLLEAKAANIRVEISKAIQDRDNLFEPFPFDPQVPSETYARTVMLSVMKKHPEILIYSLHAPSPRSKGQNIILASNINHVGKGDGPKDVHVMMTGKGTSELREAAKRAQVVVPLRDAAGRSVGVLNMQLRNTTHESAEHMMAVGEAIAEDTGRLIPDVTALYEPAR